MKHYEKRAQGGTNLVWPTTGVEDIESERSMDGRHITWPARGGSMREFYGM